MSRLLCVVAVCALVGTVLASPDPHSSTPHHPHHTHLTTSSLDDSKCTLCKGLAGVIGPLIKSNASMSLIEGIATEVCELLKIDCKDPGSCKDVCVGIIKEHAPEIIDILTDTLLAPAEVCYLVKQCPAPSPPPPPSGGIPVPSNCSNHEGEINWPAWSLHGKGHFLHLSDIHLDLKYNVGSNSQCGEPLCCRAVNGPGNSSTAAGLWGNYNCDTPLPVLQDLLQYISKMNPQPDFILYTGDDPAHDVWEQSQDANLNSIHTICSAMVQAFPHIPVFPAVGNHEVYPVNQFQGPGGDSWLYDGLLVSWAHWLPEDALNSLQYGGYYTARIRPGLRVISINTNMYIKDNFWLYQNHTDLSSQFAWLDNVLSQSMELHEQVIIIGHQISGGWYDDFALTFNAIVEKYQSVIVGQFYGHTHVDGASLWYTNSTTIDTPAGVAYIGGSITPYTNLNYGYVSYTYTRELTNPQTLVEDMNVYWTDINEANTKNQSSWDIVRFNALRDLLMSDLSLKSWQSLGYTFRHSNATSDQYNAWINYVYKGCGLLNQPLPSQTSIGCDILSTTKEQQAACERTYQGFVSEKPKDKC